MYFGTKRLDAEFEILNNCDNVNKAAGQQRRTKDRKIENCLLNSADWSLQFT